jgi:hypothetical protein
MIKNARNARWTDESHTKIELEILPEDGSEYVPFIASPTDCVAHGTVIYSLAANGIFGPILDSDIERVLRGELPVPDGFILLDGKLVNVQEKEREAQEELNRRIAALNTEEAKAMAELDGDYAAERKAKLLALLAVKQQPGWPLAVKWPD